MNTSLYFLLGLLLVTGCRQASEQTQHATTPADKEMTHCAAQTTDKDWYSAHTKAPLLEGLEGIDFYITTRDEDAQTYFNQGLMLSYGFNHAEAARSFYEATRIDSTCAMAFWGFAYVLGPNYNAGMEDDNYERAYKASQKAKALAANCTEKEKALIQALTHRYAPTPPKTRTELDQSFSHAMKKVYEIYPSDPDVSALYAESLMDMHPWDLYEKKTKKPKPWTPEIVTILEKLMKQYPNHPGAPHFYIHAVEASQHPERGLASAKLLTSLVPGSGHLVHMPSHIYIWTGDYHKASQVNIEAVKIDSAYVTACHAQGAYPLAYFPHNYHYLAATATLEGSLKWAWLAARKVQENTAKNVMKQPGWGTLQHYYSIPYYVAVKFGMWDTILAMKPQQNSLIYPKAIMHYARGMAYLGKNDVEKAQKELEQLKALSGNPILKEITIWDINSTDDIAQIAVNVLTAEVHHKKKQYDQAAAFFRKAIAIEDNLNYDEPPDWFFSVRHHLGQTLLDAHKYPEAEKVYQEDLKTFAENGWALIGLAQALQNQGKTAEADAVKKRFEKAWQYADVRITTSSSLHSGS